MTIGTPGPVPPLVACTLVLAHGAGSSAQFLAAAFPAHRIGAGVRAACYLDDRTGDVGAIAAGLARACAEVAGPVVVGGVSLGAHAAAGLLAGPKAPANAVAGLVVMPAWTGPPDRIAHLTAAAAAALAALSPAGVLAELDADDWVTPQLRLAWSLRDPDDLVAELQLAATQPAPSERELSHVRVPVGVVALADDTLHPEAVARRWAGALRTSAVARLSRDDPARDLAVFADRAGQSLAAAMHDSRARA